MLSRTPACTEKIAEYFDITTLCWMEGRTGCLSPVETPATFNDAHRFTKNDRGDDDCNSIMLTSSMNRVSHIS